MQASLAALPELEVGGREFVAAPEVRAGDHRSFGVLLEQFSFAISDGVAIGKGEP